MIDRLIVRTKCLKSLLLLFDNDKYLDNLILGDTWHPSSGFVDESILGGKMKVKQILEFDYDFEGLICFEANIGNIKIHLQTYSNEKCDLEEYELSGTKKELGKLYIHAIEQNEYHPNKYQLRFIERWE